METNRIISNFTSEITFSVYPEYSRLTSLISAKKYLNMLEKGTYVISDGSEDTSMILAYNNVEDLLEEKHPVSDDFVKKIFKVEDEKTYSFKTAEAIDAIDKEIAKCKSKLSELSDLKDKAIEIQQLKKTYHLSYDAIKVALLKKFLDSQKPKPEDVEKFMDLIKELE